MGICYKAASLSSIRETLSRYISFNSNQKLIELEQYRIHNLRMFWGRFSPERDIPSQEGKVIVVTGGHVVTFSLQSEK